MLKRLNLGRGETMEVQISGLDMPLVLRRSARARRFSLQVSEARRGAVLTVPVYSSFADAERVSVAPSGLAEGAARGAVRAGALHRRRGRCLCAAWPIVLRFAGPVRRRGVVWVEEAEDAPLAPAWPEGLTDAAGATAAAPRGGGGGARAPPSARLAQAAGACRSQAARGHSRQAARPRAEAASSCATRPPAGGRAPRPARCPSPGVWCSRRPSCWTISPRTRSRILAEMNHGPRFWALVARTMPRHEEARDWLHKHGSSLHAMAPRACRRARERGSSSEVAIEFARSSRRQKSRSRACRRAASGALVVAVDVERNARRSRPGPARHGGAATTGSGGRPWP